MKDIAMAVLHFADPQTRLDVKCIWLATILRTCFCGDGQVAIAADTQAAEYWTCLIYIKKKVMLDNKFGALVIGKYCIVSGYFEKQYNDKMHSIKAFGLNMIWIPPCFILYIYPQCNSSRHIYHVYNAY